MASELEKKGTTVVAACSLECQSEDSHLEDTPDSSNRRETYESVRDDTVEEKRIPDDDSAAAGHTVRARGGK